LDDIGRMRVVPSYLVPSVVELFLASTVPGAVKPGANEDLSVDYLTIRSPDSISVLSGDLSFAYCSGSIA
jgi:hypothetical protein